MCLLNLSQMNSLYSSSPLKSTSRTSCGVICMESIGPDPALSHGSRCSSAAPDAAITDTLVTDCRASPARVNLSTQVCRLVAWLMAHVRYSLVSTPCGCPTPRIPYVLFPNCGSFARSSRYHHCVKHLMIQTSHIYEIVWAFLYWTHLYTYRYYIWVIYKLSWNFSYTASITK